jgi:hypothetical protein
MKILIRNSDNVVMYADDSIELSDNEARSRDWVDYNFTTANATLADATLPENWTGAAFAYTKGEWTVFDQATLDDRTNSIAERASVADKDIVIRKARETALEKLLMANPEYAALVATVPVTTITE